MARMGRGGEGREIAANPVRRRHAEPFQICVVVAAICFVVLAVVAHFVPYFPADLAVSQAIQRIRTPAFAALMEAVSWPGFPPQMYFVCGLLVAALFAGGLRREAMATVLAQLGMLVGGLVKLLVVRPRPTADLVHVLREVGTTSFPSGHVLVTTTLAGFLAFLALTLLHPSWPRAILVTMLLATIPLMGASRIYLGHHWLSDVIGGYLLGSLWLLLTIHVYRRGKPRFSGRRPAVPEAPRARS